MPIEIEDVEKVATLAKLEFPSEEKQKLAKELEQIVTYVARLNELDTKAVEPTLHITDLKNVLREDNVQDWLDQEQALANAPQKKQGYFSVPKVIG
ncbi:Asp-tRNA(Asn)/Glu-tRNA(Gln) amidotransferase subunit GatC [candidate division KSB1 bacterium]|nr:Asp-tRNA(Asn)/Glu-tRNA(Gln) amidotransferase subunit GatC [candidate division KSB1 bacterium]